MNTNELEKLIEGQKEHPSLDFKASCPWDVKKLAKDIIAMSNLPDGGHIVIGIAEKHENFEREGVDESRRKTYNVDIIRDQVGKYADPMVDLDLYFPSDLSGLTFVVIRTYSFRETPTICKKDLDKELKSATIYYRNTSRRVESAAISNTTDLRNVIELAAVRLMQRRREFGFIIPGPQQKLYELEIDAANELPLVKKIKTRGFCEVNVTPLVSSNFKSLSECFAIVEQSQVQKEWLLPFIPRVHTQGRVDTAENCYQAISEMHSRKEVWRMHLTEHFYMVNAFVEDWLDGDPLRGQLAKDHPPGQYLFYNTTILYYLTLLYEFIKRLTLYGLYENGARISIQFKNTANRQLYLDSHRTLPFMTRKTTSANEIQIVNEYDRNKLLLDSLPLSNEAILKVCAYFQYSPPADAVLEMQKLILNDPLM